MKHKILSIQSFACGTEAFSFSELFINSNGREETLPINVLLCEHRKYGHFLVNTGCSSCLKKNKARFVAPNAAVRCPCCRNTRSSQVQACCV